MHAALVLSKKPHARIRCVDDLEARKSAGFAGIFLAKDIPGDNKIGPVIPDEELFASELVTCVGQVMKPYSTLPFPNCTLVYDLI